MLGLRVIGGWCWEACPWSRAGLEAEVKKHSTPGTP